MEQDFKPFKQTTMNAQIKLTEISYPVFGGVESWNPKYRDMTLAQIEAIEQDNFQSWANVGYNSFTFHRDTATIKIQRVEIKTIADVFRTDMYGLL